MGIFSALSGKTYHYNSINTPIDNELADRIKRLDDSIEKLVLVMFFDITQKTVSGIFNPDNGIMKNYTQSMDREKLRMVWNILMTYLIWHAIEDKEEVDEKNGLIKQATLVLGMDEHKIELSFFIFQNKDYHEQIIMMWHAICNQIKSDLDDYESLIKFSDMFTNIYNSIISKY